MSEYLKRENVLALAAPIPGCFSNMISSWDVVHMPAEDVERVKHGRWVYIRGDFEGRYECSECKMTGKSDWKRCPYYEAKMDL